MQNAVLPGEGLMTAIIGMTIEEVEKEINLIPKSEICEIANDNTIGQVVVSGTKKGIEILNDNLKKKKKRSIILPVSAPFHCSMMKRASDKMKSEIENTVFLQPQPNIISNVTAKEENDSNIIKSLLIKQITSRVRWRESINYLIKGGVNNFLEIGPGKVLSGLVKKINKEVKVSTITSLDDIKA